MLKYVLIVFENSVLILKKINLEVVDVFMNFLNEKLVLNSIFNNCILICNLMK